MSTTDLAKLSCTPIQKSSNPLTPQEISNLIVDIPDWQIIDNGLVQQLSRKFKFKDFSHAIQFTDKVAEIAEEQNHHPEILTEWGRVTVTWWSHAVNGLHKNDFIMAAQTSQLYQLFSNTK